MENFEFKNGQLFVENLAVEEIAKQIPTPFYCYSSKALNDKFDQYSQAFSNIKHKICYAIKANSNLSVIANFAKLGAGASLILYLYAICYFNFLN